MEIRDCSDHSPRRKRLDRRLPLLVAATVLLHCRPERIPGIEVVEAAGEVAALAGGPAAGARVRLVPADFNPALANLAGSPATTTDARGRYLFEDLAQGEYNLEAYQPADGTRLFAGGITVGKGRTVVPTAALRPPGRLRLVWEAAEAGTVYLRGTTVRRPVTAAEAAAGAFVIDSLPPGTLPPIFFEPAEPASPSRLTDSAKVTSGRQVDQGAYAAWAHAGAWTVDPAATSSEAQDYPMLVRLRAADFDFAEAQAGGRDVRFSDLGGAPLPHAVESWDAAGGRADVWVRLPRAGLPGQSFLMHWGQAAARAYPGAAAFDTASGFAGVWHLSETPGNDPGAYPDAIAGTSLDLGAGDSGYVHPDTAMLRFAGPFSVSAWVNPGFDNTETKARTILARWEEKDSAGFWLGYDPEIKGLRFRLGLDLPGRIFAVDVPDHPMGPGEWHHVAAAYDGAHASLYWDGTLLRTRTFGPAPLRDSPRALVIGARGGADPALPEVEFFRGRLDEVRVHSVVRGPEWPALDYRSQRPGSTLLSFRRLR